MQIEHEREPPMPFLTNRVIFFFDGVDKSELYRPSRNAYKRWKFFSKNGRRVEYDFTIEYIIMYARLYDYRRIRKSIDEKYSVTHVSLNKL